MEPLTKPISPSPPPADGLTAYGAGLAIGTVALTLVLLAATPSIVFGLIVAACIFVPIEKLFALRPQRTFRRDWMNDSVHFLINNVLGNVLIYIGFVVILIALGWAVGSPLQKAVARQPHGLQFIEAVVLADQGFYWSHRMAHRVPFLWRFHSVHHSIEQMDWLAAARLHPVDQLVSRTCAIAPLFLLGFSKATFGGYLVFSTLQAIFIHANVRLRFGPLRWIIATPLYHHWHHANVPEAFNKNFGGFPWVDKLFGTLYMPNASPESYGIPQPVPRNYLLQLAHPFRTPPKGVLETAPTRPNFDDLSTSVPLKSSKFDEPVRDTAT